MLLSFQVHPGRIGQNCGNGLEFCDVCFHFCIAGLEIKQLQLPGGLQGLAQPRAAWASDFAEWGTVSPRGIAATVSWKAEVPLLQGAG